MRPRIKLIDAQHFGNHQRLVANQLLNLPIAVKFIRKPMQEAYPPYFFPLHRCEQLLQMSAQLLSGREDMAASQTIIFHVRPPVESKNVSEYKTAPARLNKTDAGAFSGLIGRMD